MASPCKRQQCTIERRGFRQELDSWRHKLIHCVGFESILEGLFDPGLVEDLKLFKGCEPEAVSDWSFDENCLFCCLRRDKVKEHLVSLSNQGLEDTPKPLLVKDQTKISRLEKQAEEFLNAVLYRKDVPSSSDPHIPIVAREIMQRMIRQFAAEYTSKTSSTQDSLSDPQPSTDQSLARPPSFSGAPPSTSPSATLATSAAHNQNPVLSKLLMADQDSPLDLTVKKPPAEPSEQDGVLDLSLKKNRHSSRLSVHTPPYQSAPASTIKGEPPEIHGAKAKELQSTSTLEQFMAKLCPHHQRQIVDALGFLQTEAKASGCSGAQASNPTSGSQGVVCSTALPNLETPEKPCSQSRLPITSTPKGMLDVRETSRITGGSATVKSVIDTAISLNTSIIAGPALDLRTPGSGSTTGLSIPSLNAVDAESSRHSDHAPSLKVIIKSDGKADGKKLCVLPSSLLTHSGTLEEKQGNSDLSNRAEAHSARLSSAVKRHGQSGQLQQARQRGSIGPTKDSQGKVSVHKAFSAIPLNSPRTARKSMRSSIDHRPRESVRKVITDPDLGHYDIVYIDKPITECLREQRRPFTPRRNARKSTRGPMYVEEMWELKTVRTLANRNNRSNCPNPMPEPIASVTPKQVLAKPDGVPPVDMPLAGGCGETVSQQMPSEQPEERETPGMGDVVEAADSELDVLVETSQTDQSQVVKEPSTPPSPLSSPTENSETHVDADVNKMQEAGSNSEQVRESGLSEESSASETAAMAPLEAEKSNEPDNEITEEVAKEIMTDQLENEQVNESGPLLVSDEVPSSESAEQQECETLVPAEGDTVVEEEANKNEDGKEIGKDEEQPLEPQPEVQKVTDNLDGEQNHSPTAPAEEAAVEVQENDTVQPQENDTVQPQENDPVQPQDNDTLKQVKIEVVPETEENDDDDYDVSTKTLDALLKELPPWRRKRGMVISLPKRLRETKHEIVGYVNGRPISASDRSLRRRSVNITPSPRKTRVKSQVPKNTPVDDPVQTSPMPKDLPERDVTVKSENIPVTLQVEEPSPETTQSATRASGSLIKLRRIEPRAKQIPKRTAQSTHNTDSLPDLPIDSPQTPESRRPLRSARLKQAETAKSPQSVNTSSVVARPTGPHSLPSGEDVPSVPVSSSPLPVSSTPPIPPSSAVSESSNGSAVPENTVEPSVVKPKSPETDLSDEQKSMVDRSLPTKQKLRSSKAERVSEDENPQVSSQVSSPMKSQSSEENETPEPTTPLRSKRLLRKETEGSEGVQRKAAPSSLDEKTVGGDSANSSALDKLVKMPLRSESSKAGASSQPLPQSTPVENRKLALRSQRLSTPSTSDPRIAEKLRDIASPIRIKPEKITKMAARSSPFCETSVLSPSTVTSVSMSRNETLKQTTAQKFLGALNGEENQHLLTNLNMKFDKMQKGWLQMDKEGQTVKKHRNMSDRQAAIWKSKRRTRKPKSQDHQKHSPVQMLFMKNFSFTSICRWFLESTETKSLVIVKKVNTRLPSETQLCFHSSSGMSGTSQGVYPSLQAERLKKHLKKFAIASPVKSNPKSQKLIAKALEQEANVVRERREVFTGTRDGVTKPLYSSVEAQKQSEAQKTSGKSKNPASARILRKYSNIRLQVKQTSVRRKEAPTKRATSMKASKSGSKTNLKSTVKGQKSRLPVNKQMKESKIRKGKISSGRKATAKSPIQERIVRSPGSNRASRDLTRKDTDLPLRTSPRPGTPKRLKNKLESSKKQLETEKTGVEKSTPSKASGTRTQIKESLQSPITESRVSENKGAEITVETSQQNTDVKPPISPDQVLTRSQRKMEATVPLTESPSSASKKVSTVAIMQGGSPRSAAKKVQEPTPTGSGTPKSVTRKGQASTPPRSGTPKSSTKRAQEPLQSPAKRTRMSHSK